MNVRWSILIQTQPSRQHFLARLNATLRPQVEEHDDIEILTRLFDANMDLGTNRQKLIEQAIGQYVNFIDDDDLVPAHYISTIYPLLDGVDYIGFQLQMYSDGEKQKPTYHTLRYKEWNADQDGYYRDISHLNPMRRELALRIPMSGGCGEDQRWADGLRNLGVVKTEHYVNEIMYYYLWRSNKTDYPGPAIQLGGGQTVHNPMETDRQWRPSCPECGSNATGLAGGMRRCNQCGATWV